MNSKVLACLLPVVLLLPAAAFGMASFDYPVQAPVVSFVRGGVTVKGAGAADWADVEVGRLLASGDTVRTGPASRAEISCATGKMRLFENTVVMVPEVVQEGDKKDIRQVEMGEGTGLFRIKKRGVDKGFEVQTENIWPYDLTVFNGKLFFSGYTGGGNSQLMSYDSTGGTLALETDIGTNLGPMYLTVYNNRLYFNGTFGGVAPTEYLWSYDGTNTASTVTGQTTKPSGLIVFDGKLYFSAKDTLIPTDGPQLWSFNSTGGILSKWSNVPGSLGLFLDYPSGLNNRLYFRGYDGSNTYLYSHDGSSPIETVPGTQDFYPFYPAVFNGKIYYYAHTVIDFYDELWTYDPDSNSVTRISSISTGLSPRGFVVYPP